MTACTSNLTGDTVTPIFPGQRIVLKKTASDKNKGDTLLGVPPIFLGNSLPGQNLCVRSGILGRGGFDFFVQQKGSGVAGGQRVGNLAFRG